jgi:hypothetical protein
MFPGILLIDTDVSRDPIDSYSCFQGSYWELLMFPGILLIATDVSRDPIDSY